MSSTFIKYLRVAFCLMVSTYLALIVSTMYLASTQVALGSSIGETEAAIGRLEASYYTTVTKIDATDPSALGYVQPAHKVYARAESGPVLTRAGI